MTVCTDSPFQLTVRQGSLGIACVQNNERKGKDFEDPILDLKHLRWQGRRYIILQRYKGANQFKPETLPCEGAACLVMRVRTVRDPVFAPNFCDVCRPTRWVGSLLLFVESY